MMVAADRSAVTVAVEETGAERAGRADANPRPMTPQNRLFGEVDTGRAFQDRMIMPIMWVACFVLHVSQCNRMPPPEVGVRTGRSSFRPPRPTSVTGERAAPPPRHVLHAETSPLLIEAERVERPAISAGGVTPGGRPVYAGYAGESATLEELEHQGNALRRPLELQEVGRPGYEVVVDSHHVAKVHAR